MEIEESVSQLCMPRVLIWCVSYGWRCLCGKPCDFFCKFGNARGGIAERAGGRGWGGIQSKDCSILAQAVFVVEDLRLSSACDATFSCQPSTQERATATETATLACYPANQRISVESATATATAILSTYLILATATATAMATLSCYPILATATAKIMATINHLPTLPSATATARATATTTTTTTTTLSCYILRLWWRSR